MTTTLIEQPADTRRMWNRIAGFAGIASQGLFLGLAREFGERPGVHRRS